MPAQPQPAAETSRRLAGGAACLHDSALASCGGVVHGFFTRLGGVSSGVYSSLNCGYGSADEATKVRSNRERVSDAMGEMAVGCAAGREMAAGCAAGREFALVTVHQVHSNAVHTITRHATSPIADDNGCIAAQADAIVCARSGIAVGVLTADCAPILLADADSGIVACAHAGWKGALAGVAEATVAQMVRMGACARRIVAAVGPAISVANYQVGGEFYQRFVAAQEASARFFHQGSGGYFFDLPAYVQGALLRAGVGQVNVLHHCTYALSEHFFSNRRKLHAGEADFGRQVSVIALNQGD